MFYTWQNKLHVILWVVKIFFTLIEPNFTFKRFQKEKYQKDI